MNSHFLKQAISLIEENISNEKFGVSELAEAMHMSRSNLLRKIKSQTNFSASLFIRETRLKHAMELLKQGELNVSEISFQVGFGSTSYFIKCFHEYYGFPPGELGKQKHIANKIQKQTKPKRIKIKTLLILGAALALIIINTVLWVKAHQSPKNIPEKSIAVLPLINDSQDTSNIYLINGLMEAILNNLQNIEDLKVISRTSVEKYRNSNKSIPEIAKELGVNYIVEGSGQKIGENIQLNIQLIEAETDNHLWAEQYHRRTTDIFNLQAEVAQKIAIQIEAIVTPEELAKIKKVPTQNPIAYDYFLKGMDLFYQSTRESMYGALGFYQKAIQHDPEFARAYAAKAITYYYLDVTQSEKQYTDSINYFADQALLHDSKLAQSLLAKALYYMNSGAFEEAVPYLEKALEYNPNSSLIINFLSDFYTSYIPNTKKYLEYALKGAQLDIASHDSVSASFIYLHLSNALVQNGFVDEAVEYINRSIAFDSNNLYSAYVKAYVLYAKNQNLQETLDILLETFARDTTRLDIMQEISKVHYYQRDYEAAYPYCTAFLEAKRKYNLNIYPYEDIKLAYVYEQLGHQNMADSLYGAYISYFEKHESIYTDLTLAMYLANKGESEKAFDHLHKFEEQENFHLWTLYFLDIDPLLDGISNTPEYIAFKKRIEQNFWNKHERMKKEFKVKGLL